MGTTAILENLKIPDVTERMKDDLLAPRPVNSPEATMRIAGNRGHDFRMRVNAPRHTLVVSSIPWWPGWRISGGLRPIRVNGSFLGFVVPAGTHDVRVCVLAGHVPGGAAGRAGDAGGARPQRNLRFSFSRAFSSTRVSSGPSTSLLLRDELRDAAFASAIIALISSSLNVALSPVPCSSMKRPFSVATTFMSTPAFESSA